MTKGEFATIRALDKCRFGYRAFDLRFVRDLRWKTVRDVGYSLTRRQRFTLASIAYRYRRQLVRFLPEEQIPKDPPTRQAFGIADEPETVNDLFTDQASTPHEPPTDIPVTIQQRKLL